MTRQAASDRSNVCQALRREDDCSKDCEQSSEERGTQEWTAVSPTPRRDAAWKARPKAGMDSLEPSTPTTTLAADGPGVTPWKGRMTATGQSARATRAAATPPSRDAKRWPDPRPPSTT